MDDTDLDEQLPQPAVAFADVPVPLATFAASLMPKVVGGQVLPGEPDEVYVKLLKVRHGGERKSPRAWQDLIDTYRREPAHPADPRFEHGS